MAAGTSNILTVQLYRDSLRTPWGFRLDGGADFAKPLSVQRVSPLGAAEGQLCPGDEILEIGQKNATTLSHQDATDLIGSSGGMLRLRIARANRKSQRSSDGVHSAASSSAKPQMELITKAKDQEESVIPRNSQLAKLMNQSLKSGETQTRNGQKKAHQGYRSLPWVRQHSTDPEDITAYLPRLGKSNIPYLPASGSASPKETQIRSQVRDSLLRSPSLGSGGSGRSTPTQVLELGSPGNHKPPAVGIWIPPTHQPNSKLVHLQYNSPLNLYTPHNVADMVEKQTGQKLSWQRKPGVRFLEDIRDSPTYKLVQEIESPESTDRPRRAQSVEYQYQQSQTIKSLNRYFGVSGQDY